jgi:hypothetical protein
MRAYSEKIPNTVRIAMSDFTAGECYLVRRRKRGATSEGAQGNCHVNVQAWVDKKGGKRIPCWMLYRDRKLESSGLWIWIFHSLWQSPENEISDVTQHEAYANADYTTVWFDAKRDVDLEQGISFNNILCLATQQAADTLSNTLGYQIEVGKCYWATSSLSVVVPLDGHSGQYRWITREFPQNIRKLEEQYDCLVTADGFQPKTPNATRISTQIFLDYSLSDYR